MGCGQNLKQLRYEKGWGPEDLADAAGISRTAIYQIESEATARPRARTVKQLAQALGVSAGVIMGSEPFPIRADASAEVPMSIGKLPQRIVGP